MTLIEAINHTDAIVPNSFPQAEKVRWISTLDGIVKKEIIDTHDGAEEFTFDGYNENTLLTTELLIPAPYDDVYVRYLEMQIYYYNGEYGRYNNATAMYNTMYSAFEKYYNRTHMPKGKKNKFF